MSPELADSSELCGDRPNAPRTQACPRPFCRPVWRAVPQRLRNLRVPTRATAHELRRQRPVEFSGNQRALVALVQEFCELFAQRFVRFATVAGDDRMLEQLFLHVARQLGPDVNRGSSQDRRKTAFVVHEQSSPEPLSECGAAEESSNRQERGGLELAQAKALALLWCANFSRPPVDRRRVRSSSC